MHKARMALSVLALAVGVGVAPSRVAGYGADALFAGDVAEQTALARGVADAEPAMRGDAFGTGSELFDGEWVFGAQMMAAMGLGQVAREHPELRATLAPRVGECIDRMLSARGAAFDTRSWGEDALASLDAPTERGHVAYLGYLNLAIGMHRLVDPASRHAALGDRISRALARRLDASPLGLLETYPGEMYPVDNAAAIASLALRDDAANGDAYVPVVARALVTMRARYIDSSTGLLVQAVVPSSGAPRDAARGSGTLLAVYFLSFADLPLSRALWDAAARELDDSVLGFGVMREYPRGHAGRGDIDSGPIVFGWGVSATGFALAVARIHGDAGRFGRLYATAQLLGAPLTTDGARRFTMGGPLGDAILLAMTTARPGGAS
jgi:hypothetical protein